jgi:hypothetical protein
MLQIRRASGLCDYPRGKTAMLWYEVAPDVRAAALALAAAHAGEDLLCRHLIEIPEATDLDAFCARLTGDFVRRFGEVPTFQRNSR